MNKWMIKGINIIIKLLQNRFCKVDEMVIRRSIQCGLCNKVDSVGHRLFRLDDFSEPVCGMPYVLLPKRDTMDGCGCFLRLKWAIKSEKCPFEKW